MSKGNLMMVPAGSHYSEVPDPDADVHEAAVVLIEAARVRRYVSMLPAIEQQVVCWRFGLDDEALTVRQVAARLSMPRSTVSDIESRALSRLRGFYETDGQLAAAA